MASVLFIPNILYIMGNTRSSTSFYLSKLLYDTQNALFVLKGMLFPGDAMHDNSALINRQWNSTACYLPFVGLSLAIAYITAKRNDWLKRLLMVLVVISFSPLLNSAFLAFTAVYQRWWYMFVLMLALASVMVLDKPQEYDIIKGVLFAAFLTLLFYLCVRYIPWSSDTSSVVYDIRHFRRGMIIAMAGYLLLALLCRLKSGQYRPILVMVMCFSIVTTGITLHYYRKNTNYKDVVNSYALGTKLPELDAQYRYNTTDNLLTLTGWAAGIGCFSSTVENSSKEFHTLFDDYSSNTTYCNAHGLAQLLGGKYYTSTDASAGTPIDEVTVDGTDYYIYEQAACPIGFYVDSYVTKDDLLTLEKDQRALALMNAVVLEESDVGSVQGTAAELDVNSLDYENGLNTYVSRCIENSVKDFSRDTYGFTCRSDSAMDTLVFFSVPYDEGWAATIDGEEAEIIDTCGMMALKLPSGEHSVQFVYHTVGFKAGIIVSLFSWLTYILYIALSRCYMCKSKRRLSEACI